MILVDVYIPIIQKTYDFMLEETINVQTAIDEIVEMVCQKEGFASVNNTNGFNLFLCYSQQLLANNKSLSENGVVTGDRLILA